MTKCPKCGKMIFRTEHDSKFVCNPCDKLWLIKDIGKPNRANEVNRIGG